ncbi:PIR Superfamily Protein [Plasmodium ovale wallikeri]|uniref:PIR Superfamily Protein n=1 Tax=Plasmodium ovale wallikeri TaxID=864142 RepID=A0A1A9AN82_PLAOA|nr:PIR Superfamily Protein [Plasmodium ovale wallikeri]
MSKTITYTLNKFAEEDDIFNTVTLYKLYNKFDNTCTGEEDLVYVNDDCLLDQYQAILNPSLRIFISKLVNNLKRIGNKEKMILLQVDNNKNQICTYFKYWFIDYIIYRDYKDNDIEILFQKMDEKKGNFVESDCELYPMKLNEIKIIKKIYDYYAFYHAYNGEHEKINEKISKSRYCKKLKSGILYSDYYHTTCSKSPYSDESLCKEFNKYIKNHIHSEKNTLSSIECIGDQRSLFEDEQLKYEFSEHRQIPQDEDAEVYSQTAQDPGLTGSSMATVLPVSFVGTFSVLFLLYKFTPFRSFLNPQIQRMKSLWKSEDQETKELLINNYETEDSDTENKEYNITYHSY